MRGEDYNKYIKEICNRLLEISNKIYYPKYNKKDIKKSRKNIKKFIKEIDSPDFEGFIQ